MKLRECMTRTIAKVKKSIAFELVQLSLIFAWMILLFSTASYFAIYAVCGLCAAIALVVNRKDSKTESAIVYTVTTAFSVIFSVLVFLANYELFWPYGEKFFEIILVLIGGFTVAENVLLLLYRRLPAIDAKIVKKPAYKPILAFLIPFTVFSSIYLLYLYLSAYPGNLSSDSIGQVEQAMSVITSNHHPAWHTLIIKAVLRFLPPLFLFSAD